MFEHIMYLLAGFVIGIIVQAIYPLICKEKFTKITGIKIANEEEGIHPTDPPKP